MLINAGIKRVVAEMRYHAADRSREVFKKAGVVLEVLNDKVEQYERQ
jgi:dCMP deaminase